MGAEDDEDMGSVDPEKSELQKLIRGYNIQSQKVIFYLLKIMREAIKCNQGIVVEGIHQSPFLIDYLLHEFGQHRIKPYLITCQ